MSTPTLAQERPAGRPALPAPVTTPAEAVEVARRILDPGRARPLIVLSSEFGEAGHPLAFPLDAAQVLEEVGDVAELVLLADGRPVAGSRGSVAAAGAGLWRRGAVVSGGVRE